MGRWQPDSIQRLRAAALELFGERGYEQTTVAEIAERAGLTKRTFFRHFADKREVLFQGGDEVIAAMLEAVRTAPAGATPLEAATRGLDALGELFTERHPFARRRAAIVATSSELQERELIKLAGWKQGLAQALRERGIGDPAAMLAAETAMTVFHVGFVRWVAQDDPAALGRLMHEALADLRAVTAA